MQELRGGVVCRLLLLQLQLTAAHTAAGCSPGKQLQKRCTLNLITRARNHLVMGNIK